MRNVMSTSTRPVATRVIFVASSSEARRSRGLRMSSSDLPTTSASMQSNSRANASSAETMFCSRSRRSVPRGSSFMRVLLFFLEPEDSVKLAHVVRGAPPLTDDRDGICEMCRAQDETLALDLHRQHRLVPLDHTITNSEPFPHRNYVFLPEPILERAAARASVNELAVRPHSPKLRSSRPGTR